MSNLAPVRHVVKRGESLDVIARQNGYSNWRVIYLSGCNAQLRRMRPDPNIIHAGDNVFIPPNAKDILVELVRRRDLLTKLRDEHIAFTTQLIAEVGSELAKVERTGKLADAGATAALTVVSLTSLVKAGFKAMQSTGAQLAAQNKKLTRAVLNFAYGPIVSLVLEKYADAEQLDNNVITHYSQRTVGILLGVTSPSFWASLVSNRMAGMSWAEAVTTKPKDVFELTKRQLESGRDSVVMDMDRKIQEMNERIHQLASSVGEPLPWVIH